VKVLINVVPSFAPTDEYKEFR